MNKIHRFLYSVVISLHQVTHKIKHFSQICSAYIRHVYPVKT